eukprot:CAMPEP_0119429548 /NCGR_PEP_ID=MMETSP1335-20130426/42405_1 /TAXON_ID=259385 /ORGANISM="Chrysoculter rhomboideus, Strain RCC1486" /LENGTH=229 /DNA_ID=CAMNT_0007455267 /DNA_START=474 /DNA_END=1161 /DNA_ORIENTATION=+
MPPLDGALVHTRDRAPEREHARAARKRHRREQPKDRRPAAMLLKHAEREACARRAELRDELDESAGGARRGWRDDLARGQPEQHVHGEGERAERKVDERQRARIRCRVEERDRRTQQPGAERHHRAAPAVEHEVGRAARGDRAEESAHLEGEEAARCDVDGLALRLREVERCPVRQARADHADAEVVDRHQPEPPVEQHIPRGRAERAHPPLTLERLPLLPARAAAAAA